jgi:predicted RNase H-like HicB family nuclease
MEKTNYDILVRKDGENKYAAFCPQLNILVKGTSHEEVEMEVRKKINEYLQRRREEDSVLNENKKTKLD